MRRLSLAVVGLVSCGAIGKAVICRDLKMQENDGKIFNDPIHGHIRVNPLCVKIIDTPQFQRLRYLKQLGTAYFVYPGAPHNRFEHSIGVYHLAGEFARTLKQNQPDLNITDEDISCIEIAGLCHDLGHGPFSHMFDRDFIPRLQPGREWTHEMGSLDMLNHLINNNEKVKSAFKTFDPDGKNLIFIRELINGPEKKDSESKDYPYKGRPKEKKFLYQIVSNKENGIDVDKWDYFARDCHMLGIRNNFDHKRYMMFARVIDVEEKGKQICMRDKEASNIYGMFNTRANLYRTAYQHKVTVGTSLMILDALEAANEHIKIPGKEEKSLKMSECIDDMEAYSNLTDGIIDVIRLSNKPELKESKRILTDLHSRNIYKCVGESTKRAGHKLRRGDIPRIRREIIKAMTPEDKHSGISLTENDIHVSLMNFDYGMKDKDPVESVWFYEKSSPDEAFFINKDAVSYMLPRIFEEQVVAVYSKDPKRSDKHHIIKRCFQQWCATSKRSTMELPKIWLGPEDRSSCDFHGQPIVTIWLGPEDR